VRLVDPAHHTGESHLEERGQRLKLIDAKACAPLLQVADMILPQADGIADLGLRQVALEP
jgi:hypothetical protein